MRDTIEVASDVSRPKLMPNKMWSRSPTHKEANSIPALEEEYARERELFERYDIRAKGRDNKNDDPIAPDVYIKWLQTATYRYMMRNAEMDVSLRTKMRVHESVLAGLGYFNEPPRHGEVALTVAPHGDRVGGEQRGFVANGPRVQLHHTPAHESVAMELLRNEAISVGIGEGVHKALHAMRDSQRPYKTRWQQVEGDFDFLKPRMEARGYKGQEVERARAKAHDLNNDLGLYRRGI